MIPKISFTGRRYFLLTFGVAFVFLYLVLTEVYNRYSNTWILYETLREKEATVLDPVMLQQKKKVLTEERDSLSSKIFNERKGYAQNEIGVILCVSDNARKNQVSVESYAPGEEHLSGQIDEKSFGVLIRGRFDEVGMFINNLENESIPIDITKVQIVSDPIGNGNLKVNLQAKAYLYHGIH